MPWITVDIDLPKHSKMAGLPSDTARYGWLVVLCEAKRQRTPGTFASDRHFREVVGRFGKHLPDYLAARLLERDKDDALAVHDWQQYQWRVAKARQREDTGETNRGQTEDENRTSRARNVVPVPVGVSLSTEEDGTLRARGTADDEEPEFPLLQWLSAHGCYITPGNGYHVRLITAVERHGANALIGMFDRLSRAGVVDGDTKGFVFGAIDALNPKPDLRALEAEEDAEEARQRKKRREEANALNLAYLRGETGP